MLAVAETGSATLSAAQILGVSQSTVSRKRSPHWRQRLRLEIFDKRRAGYALTAAALGERLSRNPLPPSGTLHIISHLQPKACLVTCPVRYALRRTKYWPTFLSPNWCDAFKMSHPGIGLDVDTTNILRDLKGGEADVALRAAPAPMQPDLVRIKLAGRQMEPFYCAQTYVRTCGVPRTITDPVLSCPDRA